MKLNVALQWPLNVNYLAIVVSLHLQKYAQNNLDVKLLDYTQKNSVEDLIKNKVHISTISPLYLLENYNGKLKSLGCFFETRGGLLFKKSSFRKLQNDIPIKVISTDHDKTNLILLKEVLKRYCMKNNLCFDVSNIIFLESSCLYVTNMKEKEVDAAWVCYSNYEEKVALLEELDVKLIEQFESPYPNFSALEFVTTKEMNKKYSKYFKRFVDTTSLMAEYCKNNPEHTKEIYYDFFKKEKNKTEDTIIDCTLECLKTNVVSTNERWQNLYEFLNELNIINLSQKNYNNIWI